MMGLYSHLTAGGGQISRPNKPGSMSPESLDPLLTPALLRPVNPLCNAGAVSLIAKFYFNKSSQFNFILNYQDVA